MNASTAHKVHFKIGDAEFSAEGDVETCKTQFDDFMKFVSAGGVELRRPAGRSQPAARENGNDRENGGQNQPAEGSSSSDRNDQAENAEGARLRVLFHEDDRHVISLQRLPDTGKRDRDGLLLMLLGYRLLKNQRSVSARALMLGAKQSGITVVDRVSNFLGPFPDLVTRETGRHGSCYALTNPGVDFARDLLNKVLAQA